MIYNKVELAGPVALIAAVICAEIGALALANWPTSSVLWYLNLELFRSFEYSFTSFAIAQRLMTDQLVQALWITLPLFGLICSGVVARSRLALALASNLSLLYSALLLNGAYLANNPMADFSLRLSGFWAPACILTGGILLVSLISTITSHQSYWREIFP